MIEQNHESHVSLEVAKLLKEAGFDWKVNARWLSFNGFKSKEAEHMRDLLPMDDFELVTDVPYENQNEGNTSYLYSAPTLDVAQRWLREVKGYYVAWEFNMNISSWGQDLYDFTDISVYIFVASEQGNICKCKLKENYKTIEEAQEAGIKKTLETILEKGE